MLLPARSLERADQVRAAMRTIEASIRAAGLAETIADQVTALASAEAAMRVMTGE